MSKHVLRDEVPRGNGMTIEDLNAEVTTAIMLAQQADRDALKAWQRVRDAELALATTHPDGVERDIAWNGVGLAEAWINILEHR